AGRLDMLHQTNDMYILAIGDRVGFRFLRTIEKVVDQHAIARKVFQQSDYRPLELFVIDDNTHALPTKHITRPYQHWVSDFIGYSQRFFSTFSNAVLRVGDIEIL